jgi:hypothetical protein
MVVWRRDTRRCGALRRVLCDRGQSTKEHDAKSTLVTGSIPPNKRHVSQEEVSPFGDPVAVAVALGEPVAEEGSRRMSTQEHINFDGIERPVVAKVEHEAEGGFIVDELERR